MKSINRLYGDVARPARCRAYRAPNGVWKWGASLITVACFAMFISMPVHAQTAAITGKVKERDGKMLGGVIVTAAKGEVKVDATTNEKGEFELKALKAGDYVLTFQRAGYQTFTTRSLTVASGETIKLRSVIELSQDRPSAAIIRGAVFTADGFSLPNASVKIERIGEGKRLKRETVSADGGEFGFRLPAEKATYRITASARGFEPTTKEIEVGSDEVRQIALSLERVK